MIPSAPIFFRLHPLRYRPHPFIFHPRPFIFCPRSFIFHPCPFIFHPRPFIFRPRSFIFHPHPFIFRPRPFTFRPCPLTFRPRPFIFHLRPFTFCPRAFRIFRARVVYVCACRTNVRTRQLYVNVRENIVRTRGFPSGPDDIRSTHSTIPSALALMRLRSRVRARQLLHVPEGL
jgi:hypothetical protein